MEFINWATGERRIIREKVHISIRKPEPKLSFEEITAIVMKDCIECTATNGKVIITKKQVK